MSEASENVKVIAKRADWLAERIAASPERDLYHDRAELRAHHYAIALISQLRCLCRFCHADATAKLAGNYVCDACLKERGIEI